MTDNIQVRFTVHSGISEKFHSSFESEREAVANAIMASIQDRSKFYRVKDTDGLIIHVYENGTRL